MHSDRFHFAEQELNGAGTEYAGLHRYALVGNCEVGTLASNKCGDQDE
jgi:hypothetical protein